MPHPATGHRRLGLIALVALLLVGLAGTAGARGRSPLADTPTSPPLPRPPWTGNLLIGNQGTFNDGTGGWSPSNGAHLLHLRKPAQSGGGSLAVTNLTRHVGVIYAASGHNHSTYTRGIPGNRYSFNFWARGTVDGQEVAGELVFLDASGRELAAVFGMHEKEFADKWVHMTNTVAVAPPTTRYVFARAVAFDVLPGETQLVDTALLQRAPGSAKSVHGPLRTSGNKIVDSTGAAIRLRGFVRMGLQGGPIESQPTSHDIGQAKAWGANVVRLALGEQKWPGLPQASCHVDSNYPAKVDNAVNLITGMGMYAVLEMHWNTVQQCGQAKPQPMADCNPGACNANAFWTAVANRYKGNPLVGFDLYNEPHNISEPVWRNGGTVTYNGVTFTAAGMQPMYNAVRATGASNLVFITGTTWGNNFPKNGPISGTNIVYSVHSYTCPAEAPPNCSSPTPYDGSIYLKNWVTAGKTYPVFVGEFGFPNPSSSQYAQSLITFAEAHGWGWADFTWGNNGYSRFALMGTRIATYEPTPGGMPALQTFAGG